MSLSQLAQLLPLPDEDLKQILHYAQTLSKPEAAEHFNNLLGDSPLAVDFITSFNSHRKSPLEASTPAAGPVPRAKRNVKKPKAALHVPEPRRLQESTAPATQAYNKRDQDLDYVPQRAKPSGSTSNNASRSSTPPVQAPQPRKQHASSAGRLISDLPAKAKSNPASRSSTPKPASTSTAKVSIAGGVPMAGQSTALTDLDAAIRALEITTNPTLATGERRKCNCVATKHPLQAAAPNCLSCGKVICMMEGLGPCSFCGSPLLSADEVQAIVRELKDERGREKMAANAAANRRAEISQKPAPFSNRSGNNNNKNNDHAAGGRASTALADAAVKAREHRDKLLTFQAQNAQRTTIRDEAADFDVTSAMSGTGSMWASPEERAKELKRQQKLLREMEWNARPDYEKRQQIVSIDLVGGKVVRKMAAVERPVTPEEDVDSERERGVLAETSGHASQGGRKGGGAFSRNPLLGSLMRPIFEVKDADQDAVVVKSREERMKRWRRVQDDLDDNEHVILDGGVYGHSGGQGNGDEPACG